MFSDISIWEERPEDHGAIRTVHLAAFGRPAEADLVDALRRQAAPVVSLVALENERVVGHVMFSPVALSSRPDLSLMGLAPLAVHPQWQRRGIGSALVEYGLDRCLEYGRGAVVVLGHSGYYPRFGFSPAAPRGIVCEYDAPEEAFLLRELEPGYLAGASGTVHFHAAFAAV